MRTVNNSDDVSKPGTKRHNAEKHNCDDPIVILFFYTFKIEEFTI